MLTREEYFLDRVRANDIDEVARLLEEELEMDLDEDDFINYEPLTSFEDPVTGDNALIIAARNNNQDMMDLLVKEGGADIYSTDANGHTAYDILATHNIIAPNLFIAPIMAAPTTGVLPHIGGVQAQGYHTATNFSLPTSEAPAIQINPNMILEALAGILNVMQRGISK